MVSKAYRRITLLIFVIFGCLFLYIMNHTSIKSSILQNSHILDSITQVPIETEEVKVVKEALSKVEADKDVKKEEELQLDPCTVYNPATRGYIDLRELSSINNQGKARPWTTKGYDSGKNYTLGICSTPFKKLHDKEMKDDVDASLVGGFYIDPKSNKYVSIGEYATTPVFRGRKMVLTYNNGSYCDNLVDNVTGEKVRKSTVLTFTCDREMMSKAHISFLGTTNDCSYLFEVRSHHACPTAAKADNLAVIWIFLIIFLAALLVYFSGGFLYRQMKHHRQTKNSF